MELDIAHMRITIWLTLAALFTVIVFAVFPFLDLKISAVFFLGEQGRWLAGGPVFEFWRNVLRRSGEIVAALTFVIFVGNLLLGQQQHTGWRVWAYIWISTLSCSGILVNGILKSNIGRARPSGILEFGGHQLFTPPFQLSHQCSSNCSFSSGEVALVASLLVPICVLIWPQLSYRGKSLAAGLVTLALVVTAVMRIAAGRHFLSDTTASMLFAALISVFLYRVLSIGQHRHVFKAGPVFADVANIVSHGSRHAFKRSKAALAQASLAAKRLWIAGYGGFDTPFR